MNYIKEINAFYDWLETNSVSDSSVNLWHALMAVNNKCGWKVEFPVAISTLCGKTSLSKSSIIRARNLLKQLGRIDFRERKGNQSCTYKLIAFHTDTQNVTQSGTQTDTQSATQTDTILKLNKTKLNNVLFKKEPKDEIFVDEVLGTEKKISDPVIPEIPPKEKISAKKEKFAPPTVQQVQDYCNERQNGIQAFSFVSFYQSKGWMVGKNQMKDWKAAIHTWESKNKEQNGNSNTGQSNSNSGNATGHGFKNTGKVSARTVLAKRLADQNQNKFSDSDGGNFTVDAEIVN